MDNVCNIMESGKFGPVQQLIWNKNAYLLDSSEIGQKIGVYSKITQIDIVGDIT